MLNNYSGVGLGGEEKNNILIHALYEIMINLEEKKICCFKSIKIQLRFGSY
jgi:hypothetical protein